MTGCLFALVENRRVSRLLQQLLCLLHTINISIKAAVLIAPMVHVDFNEGEVRHLNGIEHVLTLYSLQ